MRFVLYAVGLMFLSAALALAFLYLGKPESARTGRGMVWAAIAHVSSCVLVAIAIVAWLVLEHPEFLP